MAGLRERKKENNRKKILESALQLFEEQGFEKTAMERIAHEADLGVGTLYNYFPSKMKILFSIIEAGSGKYLEALDEVIACSSDLRSSVNSFFGVYLKSFSTYGKRVWREMFSEIFRQPDYVKLIDSIDSSFIERLKELLTVFRKKGVLKNSVNVESASEALYSVLAYNIIRYAINADTTDEKLMETLREQVRLIIDGLAPESKNC